MIVGTSRCLVGLNLVIAKTVDRCRSTDGVTGIHWDAIAWFLTLGDGVIIRRAAIGDVLLHRQEAEQSFAATDVDRKEFTP